jgi:hypothetical protein
VPEQSIASLGSEAEGVVITERIVSTAPGSAAGTFSAVGAISGRGTAIAEGLDRLAALREGAPLVIEAGERLVTPTGEIRIELCVSVRPVPGTGVLTGGGTWHVASGSGTYDGTRAAGTLTVKAVREDDGSTAVDLVLVGRARR